MTRVSSALLLAAALSPVPNLFCQASPSTIAGELGKLRSLPDQQRGAATIQVAHEIAALPAGIPKIRLADKASQLVTEGDQGHGALRAVADALSKALAETPIRTRGDDVPEPYLDLARLARYEDVNVSLEDPLYRKALNTLASNDAEVAKADFTLTDLNQAAWTLSQLRGKIVLVNFWATWCPPCRTEMPVLDALYADYRSQGLVILSISDESASTVSSFLQDKNYHPPVLLDPGDKAHSLFHVTGIPKTFVFDRDGKLVGEAIDQSTEKQFLALLAQAGIKPE